MRLYPSIPQLRLTTFVQDVAFLLVLALLGLIAWRVYHTVDKLSVLGSSVHDIGEKVPLVGGEIADAGEHGENAVHSVARLLAFATGGVPAVLVCIYYLPGRLRQIRKLTAASRVLDGADARLVAMRAAFDLPYARLLQYSRDPLGDLEAGRYDPLVAAALEDVGLRPR